jgi:hypothetical protein
MANINPVLAAINETVQKPKIERRPHPAFQAVFENLDV